MPYRYFHVKLDNLSVTICGFGYSIILLKENMKNIQNTGGDMISNGWIVVFWEASKGYCLPAPISTNFFCDFHTVTVNIDITTNVSGCRCVMLCDSSIKNYYVSHPCLSFIIFHSQHKTMKSLAALIGFISMQYLIASTPCPYQVSFVYGSYLTFTLGIYVVS